MEKALILKKRMYGVEVRGLFLPFWIVAWCGKHMIQRGPTQPTLCTCDWLQCALLQSQEVRASCKEVVQTCNAFAMEFLGRNDRVNALLMLQRAEAWTDPDIFMRYDGMRALTLNNYACYYKKYAVPSVSCLSGMCV